MMPVKVSAAQSAPSLTPDIERALDAVITARHDFEKGSSDITEESLQEMLSAIESSAAAANLNQIFSADNDGDFEAFPITGRTATRLSMPLPLGMLSFGMYAPESLTVNVMGAEELSSCGYKVVGVFKGRGYGFDNAYVISTAFKIPNTNAMGVSRAIGTYSFVNDHRLDIKFSAMRLEPLTVDPGAMAEWKEALLQHNPEMDPESGILEVSLPKLAPGWQDYLLMGPDHQLLVGNSGSKTLLKRLKN